MNEFAPPLAELRPLREVHRALAELRRGAAVLVTGEAPLVAIAAETASAEAIADAAAIAARDTEVALVVSADRAAALPGGPPGGGAHPVALALGRLADLRPDRLRRLADPTAAAALPALEAAPLPALGAAALSLAKLARLLPATLAAAAGPDAEARAQARGVLAVGAEAVLRFAGRNALALSIVAEAPVPLADAADARLVAFRAPEGGVEHMAVVVGDPAARPAPLVRLHSECFTGDLLGSLRCDCGDQLRGAIRRISAEGAGVVLYLAQEGRGIGLANKLRAYTLQDRGLDTMDANKALGWGADERDFLVAATMLRRLGLERVRLLTNNPDKIAALGAHGIEVVERVAIVVPPNGIDDAYLATKRRRFGHLPP